MTLQTIERGGKRFVLVAQPEFKRLVARAEAYDEIARFDAAIADMGTTIPSDVFHRVLKGEHPVKVYREWRELTQAQLAQKAKVSRALIAQIESGHKQGGLRTCKAIATILGVDIEDIS